MLKEYQELLASLTNAQDRARALVKRGAPTERVYRALEQPIREVRQRVRFMEEAPEREAERQAAAKKAAAKQPDAEATQRPLAPENAGRTDAPIEKTGEAKAAPRARSPKPAA